MHETREYSKYTDYLLYCPVAFNPRYNAEYVVNYFDNFKIRYIFALLKKRGA
jgi:uncharacterized protein YdiU (UPF0061 family)